MAAGEHSVLPPSSANIWGARGGCPGWVQMNRDHESPETEHTQRGDAAHELAERMLRAVTKAGVGFPSQANTVGQPASNGIVYDEELYQAAHDYVAVVSGVINEARVYGGPNLGIEARLRMPQIHPEAFGTCDFYLFDAECNRLYVYDFKSGRRVVDPFENLQLIMYCAGVFEKLGPEVHQDVTVTLGIVQPRGFHADGPHRTWTTTVGQLQQYVESLKLAAGTAMSAEAKIHSGAHCRFCDVRFQCPAAIKTGLELVEQLESVGSVQLSDESLGLLYRLAYDGQKFLDKMAAAYREQLEHRVKAGAAVPGYRLEPSFGREQWDAPFEKVIILGKILGYDLQRQATLTPAQARKLGMNPDVIRANTSRPNNGMSLKFDDGSKARKVFGS